jgi:uncharacterized membrane protein
MKRSPTTEAGRPAGTGPEQRTEDGLNLTISRVLVAGLALAIILLLVGVLLALVEGDAPSSGAASLGDMPRAIAALEPQGFYSLGLLVLLLTPVGRVVALVVAFARRGAWLFSLLSLFVLAVLGLSAYLGLTG